jgi:hypothetical protein
LLLDLESKEINFYQGVETIEDLNPVFQSPSMTPFRFTCDSKKERFAKCPSSSRTRPLVVRKQQQQQQ